LIEEIPII